MTARTPQKLSGIEPDADPNREPDATDEPVLPALPPEVQAGTNVYNPVTKTAYFLPADEKDRMALCFPIPTAEDDAAWRLSWSPETSHTEVIEGFSEALADDAVPAFVLANYDHLGYRAALLLTSLKMNAQYRSAQEEVERLEGIRRAFVFSYQVCRCAIIPRK